LGAAEFLRTQPRQKAEAAACKLPRDLRDSLQSGAFGFLEGFAASTATGIRTPVSGLRKALNFQGFF
jgi:hypothetical protein